MLIVTGPTGGEGHDGGSHPERPARIPAVMAGVADLHLGSDLRILSAPPATLEQLTAVHSAAYLDELAAFCRGGGGELDPDTYARPDSWDAARRAAGAGLAAVDGLRRFGALAAFVAARPPGHHAMRDRGMGFCLLNNIAVAAAALTGEGERVLVLDWDVHHGNGTQSIFWDDPRVLYVSTHQAPLYPGTGMVDETGGPRAPGLTVNVPLPAGCTGDVVRRAIEEIAAPVIDRFDPTWVLVSAGFDAHRADPLANMALSAGDFADLATLAARFAPGAGRLVLFLEGGYDLPALRSSVRATLGALVGITGGPEAATFGGPGGEMVERARAGRAAALAGAGGRSGPGGGHR